MQPFLSSSVIALRMSKEQHNQVYGPFPLLACPHHNGLKSSHQYLGVFSTAAQIYQTCSLMALPCTPAMVPMKQLLLTSKCKTLSPTAQNLHAWTKTTPGASLEMSHLPELSAASVGRSHMN